MKLEYRAFLLGGEILEHNLKSQGRAFTRVVPTSDAVFVPHEAGDLIAMWAMTMCMRDSLVTVEPMFPDFRYADKLQGKSKARKIDHESPLADLHWWQERLPVVIEMEKRLVYQEYVSVAVNPEHALASLSAVDWFVRRHHCRPPGVAEGLQGLDLFKDADAQADPSERSLTQEAPKVGMEALSPADRRSVEAVRAFEESDFSFLEDLGADVKDDGKAADQKPAGEVSPAVAIDKKEFSEMDELDKAFFGSVSVQRAEAPDGFRKEDRDGFALFRKYVTLAVKEVPPVKARWVDKVDKQLGQDLFAYAQLLFSASFPNADSAKLREEDMAAERARVEREAEEKKMKQQGGGDYGGG